MNDTPHLFIVYLTRGVPFPVVCKNRKERIAAIGDAVAKSDYHIVALQEVGPTVCIYFQLFVAKVESDSSVR